MFSLQGQKALIVGIANEQSIAWGCALALKAQGADLAVTWLNDKAGRFVRPLAEELDAEIMSYSPILGQIFGGLKLLPEPADRFHCC
jgi:enoyl-[acyl-carrier protein] reductase I